MTAIKTLDVTRIEPRLKHRTIFETFDNLKPEESFIISNDHDPKPLYYEFKKKRGDLFDWHYLQEGPKVWQIKIKKKDAPLSVGEMAVKDIRKAGVFKKFGIDFCCGGKKSLELACTEAWVDIAKVRKELDAIDKMEVNSTQIRFETFGLDFLIDYILTNHHKYIKENAEVIDLSARKVATAHGEFHPELYDMAENITRFLNEMLAHLEKEEKVIFPYIKELLLIKKEEKKKAINMLFGSINIINGSLQSPIKGLEKEHEESGEDLRYFRSLTNNYFLPPDACNTYRYLFEKMKEFENDLFDHIHLENNVLFPKALRLEEKLGRMFYVK